MIHEFTIANGLKVIGIESHKSPVVSVQMWVRNGSADERLGEEGLSHFIEHLVFKGSRSFGVGEIASVVEACGGEINAYTSFDQTVYYVTISSRFYETALKVVSEMVGYPKFEAEEIEKEREVVVEEIKRGNDSLSRQASRLLFSNMYKGYPYSVPVIGYENIVRTVSPQKIRDFFEQRYVPQNMFLVVTGDFTAKDFRQKVEEYFGGFEDRAVQMPERPAMSILQDRKIVVEKTNFEETVLYLAWPGVNILHEDLPAVECLSMIFGQGASSRLYQALRLKTPIVNSIGAGAWAPATQGFLSISASLNVDNLPKALEVIKQELEKLFAEGVTQQELDKAKINFLSDEAYSLETVGGLARKYGGDFESTGNMFFHEVFNRQLQAVTLDKVREVASKYLDAKKMLISCLVPKNPEETQKHLESWHYRVVRGTAAPTATVAPIAALKKRVSTETESVDVGVSKSREGLRTFHRQSTAAPIFNLRWVSMGGSRMVSSDKAGLAELVGRTWSAQTFKNPESQLKMKIDSLASSVYSYSGRNTFGVVVDGLSAYQKELSDFMVDTFLDADITVDILEREKKVILESLRSRKDSPSTVASLNFNKMMFEGHPYAVDALGDERTLASITVDDVRSYLKSFLCPADSVAAICGDFDRELWRHTLEKISSAIPSDPAPRAQFAVNSLNENRFQFEKAEKEQTQIIYGFRGLTLNDPDRFALQVIEAILAGQGGRLFLELRDKASLAYSVSPLRMEGIELGYFGAYIGCSPEKSEIALKMMREELMKLTAEVVGDEEIERAKNYLIGGHDIGLQKNSALSSSIAFNEIYNLSWEEVFKYRQFVASVTADDVMRVAKKLFGQKHVISVVGPREPKNFF